MNIDNENYLGGIALARALHELSIKGFEISGTCNLGIILGFSVCINMEGDIFCDDIDIKYLYIRKNEISMFINFNELI